MNDDNLQMIFNEIDQVRDLSDAELDALLPTSHLLERLRSAVEAAPGARLRKRVWRRSMVVSVSAVLVLASAAAALTFLPSPVKDTTRLSCFAKVSLTGNANVVAYSQHPLASCESVMQWVSIPTRPTSKGTLCVLNNGSLAGFPPSKESHVCATLGLATFDGHLASMKSAAFQETIQSYFTAHPCVALSVAKHEAQRLLAKYNLSKWRVKVSGSKATSACATLSVQVSNHLVGIVGFGS